MPSYEIKTLLIDSIGYNVYQKVLVVRLSSGDIVSYPNIPLELYEEFANSEDHDTFFLNEIKEKYKNHNMISLTKQFKQ